MGTVEGKPKAFLKWNGKKATLARLVNGGAKVEFKSGDVYEADRDKATNLAGSYPKFEIVEDYEPEKKKAPKKEAKVEKKVEEVVVEEEPVEEEPVEEEPKVEDEDGVNLEGVK